jgi:FKBP-type peptidyl-prolyl cis-trans isomerase
MVPAATIAAEGQRELPGKWAFRARGTPFDADFGQDFTKLENGLSFKDEKIGDGKEIADGVGVKINFVGYILGDGKKFDSTWDKGRYVAFKVSA